MKKFLVFVAYFAVVMGLFYFAMKFCLGYLLPFVIGTLIAISVQKPAQVLCKRIKLSHGTVALFMVIAIYLIVLIFLFLIGNKIYFAALDIYERMPEYAQSITNAADSILEKAEKNLSRIPGAFGEYIASGVNNTVSVVAGKLAELFSNLVSGLISGAPGFVFSLLVTVVSGCYIAKDFDVFKRIISYALNEKQLKKLNTVRRITVNSVLRTIKVYVLLSLIAFVIVLTGLMIMGVKGAAKTAFLIALVDFLPVFGCGTVLIPWAVIGLIKGNTALFIGIMVIYAVVTVVRNVLESKIMGKQMELHPLLTLISLFLGLRLFGVLGMFILPLVITVIYKYAEERVTAEEEEHSM